MVTPCEGGSCIALDRLPDGLLLLSSSQSEGSVLVSAAEVRAFAAAVQSGYFDELLGGAELHSRRPIETVLMRSDT